MRSHDGEPLCLHQGNLSRSVDAKVDSWQLSTLLPASLAARAKLKSQLPEGGGRGEGESGEGGGGGEGVDRGGESQGCTASR